MVGAAVLLGALPAQAGLTQWKDAEGDATGVYNAEVLPIPSEPALDITTVTMTSDGTRLTWSAGIKKLSTSPPQGATGYSFRFAFRHEEVPFYLTVAEDSIQGTSGTRFQQDPVAGDDLSCRSCVGKIDRKDNRVTITAPLASLSSGIREFDRSLPPVTPGTKVDGLEVLARRQYDFVAVLIFPTVDASRPAPGTLFTF